MNNNKLKTNKVLGILILIVLLCFVTSCKPNPDANGTNISKGKGAITVKVDNFTAGMKPESTTGIIAGYEFNAISSNGEVKKVPFTSDMVTVSDLSAGNWTVYIAGYNVEGKLIAKSKELNVAVKAYDIIDVNCDLFYESTEGKGKFKLDITLPIENTTVALLEVVLLDETGKKTTNKHSSFMKKEAVEATEEKEGIPAHQLATSLMYITPGSYRLEVTTYSKKGDVLTLDSNFVHIFEDETTNGKINLISSEFPVEAPVINTVQPILAIGDIITIETATEDATIYYTLDSTEPIDSHTRIQYIEPIEVTDPLCEIRAVAVKNGYDDSEVVSAGRITDKEYMPRFSAVKGTYVEYDEVFFEEIEVKILNKYNAKVKYTLDGSSPTLNNGMTYTDPITIDETTTVKAIAIRPDGAITKEISKTFEFMVKETIPSIEKGTYKQTFDVILSTETPNSIIYYTLDGSTPSMTNGLYYINPIKIDRTTTLNAIAVKDGYTSSKVASIEYKLELPEAPKASYSSGMYNQEISVELINSNTDSSIYYTLDGDDPASGILYTNEPLKISEKTVLRAIEKKNGWSNSPELKCEYQFNSTGETSIEGPKLYSISINEVLRPNTESAYMNKQLFTAVINILNSDTPGTTSGKLSYKWYLDGKLLPTSGNVIEFSSTSNSNYEGEHRLTLNVSDGVTSYTTSMNVNIKIFNRGPAGGFVFYDCDADNTLEDPDGADDMNSDICKWRYLEAAPFDIVYDSNTGEITLSETGNGYLFGTYENPEATEDVFLNGLPTYSEIECTSSKLGSGKANNKLMIEKMGYVTYSDDLPHFTNAAALCAYLEYNGYGDWYLPSSDELKKMLETLGSYGNFQSGTYLSSSEDPTDPTMALGVNSFNYRIESVDKDGIYKIRPIRAYK